MTATAVPGRSAQMSPRLAWAPAAAALLGAGWGSNQFSPMLLVYARTLGLGTGTVEAVFGFYALGLIPGLLLAGPLSDAYGRRAVVVPAAALSLLASIALVAGRQTIVLLFLGRLLTGLSTGAVFSAGTAWLRELSRRPPGNAGDVQVARRTAVAMTAGFALGPLVAGLLAQWAPAPAVVPFLSHIVLMAAILILLRATPETVSGAGHGTARFLRPSLSGPRFRTVVAPMAPWVFAAPAIAFGLLPTVTGAAAATDGIALTAGITGLCALAGVLIQPAARRLSVGANGNRAATIGLLVAAAGLGLAAVTALERQLWMLVPCSITLGSAYGLCLVAGLVEVQRLAHQRTLAAATAAFYALTYLGFTAPFLLTLAAPLADYPESLTAAAALALGTAALVTRRSPVPRERASGQRAAACPGGAESGAT